MDIEELIEKAKQIGHAEIPDQQRDNLRVKEVLIKIFNAYPTKFFVSKDLKNLLADEGLEVSKLGHVLYGMKAKHECIEPRKGTYGSIYNMADSNSSICCWN